MVKNLPVNAGDPDSIHGSGRSSGEGSGYPPAWLPEEFHGQKSLAGYSPWGHKDPGMTKRFSLSYLFLGS